MAGGILPGCIRRPANPSPRVPANSEPYKVTDQDDWFSVAKRCNMDVWALIRFNYPTLPANNAQAAPEVNWYLEHYVGCRKLPADNKNYCSSSSAAPGFVYLPRPGGGTTPAPAPAPPPTVTLDFTRFDRTLDYMYAEMYTNSRSTEIAAIKAGNLGAGGLAGKAAALAAFPNLVRTGARWDHKPILRRMLHLSKGDDHFPFRGDSSHEFFYDIWSNVHYGYVGRAAAFTEWELQHAHQLGGFTGATDPFDIETVQLGIDLWRLYGSSLTKAQLHAALLARAPTLLTIQASPAYVAANPPPFVHIEPITDGK
jgi:hypothetical protein